MRYRYHRGQTPAAFRAHTRTRYLASYGILLFASLYDCFLQVLAAAFDSWQLSCSIPNAMPSMRCTLLAAALLVPLSAPSRRRAAREAPRKTTRGALRALPRRRLRGREGGRRAHPVRLDRRARAVDTLKANAKDLLTKTDVACQDVAAAVLARREPASRLLGEEDVAPGGDAARRAAEKAFSEDGLVWAVDPIDGTANFVDAIPLSATSVAAVECVSGNCRVVAGAVYDPYRDELFGRGVW